MVLFKYLITSIHENHTIHHIMRSKYAYLSNSKTFLKILIYSFCYVLSSKVLETLAYVVRGGTFQIKIKNRL